MNDYLPDDAICLEEPTCMECGRECSTTEYVWTGDSNSYKGWNDVYMGVYEVKGGDKHTLIGKFCIVEGRMCYTPV